MTARSSRISDSSEPHRDARSRIRLIAASDDYLLQEQLSVAVQELCGALGGVEPEIQNDEATPESVAMELVSPSLFAGERVLVVPDARLWLEGAPPPGVKATKESPPDPQPLIHVLGEGVPEGMGLVMGAWCGRKPGGELLEALAAAGSVDWVPLPPPPKPWEDAVLSQEQRRVLEAVLVRAAGRVRFSPRAKGLLLDRLGFAPRLLVQEVRKLSGAAGDAEVDEDLVRRLTFPRERSLEVVRDSVLNRRLAPLLDLVAAAGAGSPVNDWRGQRVELRGLGPILVAQVTNLLTQMLYLRRFVQTSGLGGEMATGKTDRRGWYNQHFKSAVAPGLLAALKEDSPSPLVRPKAKPPTPFSLGAVFSGAARYTDGELVSALADGSEVEAQIRQEANLLEVLTAWLSACVGSRPR